MCAAGSLGRSAKALLIKLELQSQGDGWPFRSGGADCAAKLNQHTAHTAPDGRAQWQPDPSAAWKQSAVAMAITKAERARERESGRARVTGRQKKKGAMHIAARCPPPRTLSVHTHRDVLLELYRTSIAPPRPLVHSSIRHHPLAPSPSQPSLRHAAAPSALPHQHRSSNPRPRQSLSTRSHSPSRYPSSSSSSSSSSTEEPNQRSPASPPRFHRCPCPANHIFACNHQPPFPLPSAIPKLIALASGPAQHNSPSFHPHQLGLSHHEALETGQGPARRKAQCIFQQQQQQQQQ
ncbi:hypothetical protein L1887_54518 [Cichorium endivia]|nr:hypothetical protein L1887_54518 [Cichorium endivia]